MTFIVFFLLFSELLKGICLNLCGIVLKPTWPGGDSDPADLGLKLDRVEKKIKKEKIWCDPVDSVTQSKTRLQPVDFFLLK